MGLCPRCGEGNVFHDLLNFRSSCPSCGLDVSAHDNGDGPVFFVIVIVGFVVTGLAAWVEFAFRPPFWLHAVLWLPLILGLSIVLLRYFKLALLAAQIRHKLLGDEAPPPPPP